jgi:hypothetical protein
MLRVLSLAAALTAATILACGGASGISTPVPSDSTCLEPTLPDDVDAASIPGIDASTPPTADATAGPGPVCATGQ